MSDMHLTITPDEGDQLVRVLETALREERVEEHRTDSRAFRDRLHHEISLLESLLTKLRSPAVEGAASPQQQQAAGI